MADMTQKAYEATSVAAHKIARGIVESLCDAIKAGEVTDSDGLADRMHEECDSACIYTADRYALVWGLPDEEDAIDSGFTEPRCLTDVLTAQAFLNLRTAVEGAEEWEELLQVAEDARLERGSV
jgi:hypothetical protein